MGGFVRESSSDSYVLLGGGGHKLESSLSVGYAAASASATYATSAGSVAWNNITGKPSIPQDIWRYTEISAGDTLTLQTFSGIFYIATCPYWGYGQIGWWDRDGGNNIIYNTPGDVPWFNPTYTWTAWGKYQITCPDVLYQHSLHFTWQQYAW